MDIKEFVSETLVQICNGIVDAQERAKETGAIISPRMTKDGDMAIPEEVATGVDAVNFDIAVEVKAATIQGDKSSVKAHISICGINAGADVGGSDETKNSSASVSRIKFTVHACWPVQKLTREHRCQLEGEPNQLPDSYSDGFAERF